MVLIPLKKHHRLRDNKEDNMREVIDVLLLFDEIKVTINRLAPMSAGNRVADMSAVIPLKNIYKINLIGCGAIAAHFKQSIRGVMPGALGNLIQGMAVKTTKE